MLLSSVQRIKASYGFITGNDDLAIGSLLSTCSLRIAAKLRRADSLDIKTRTIDISPRLGQRKFYLPAYPIASVSSIEYDATGLFAGSETDVTDFIITEGRAVVIPYGIFTPPNFFISQSLFGQSLLGFSEVAYNPQYTTPNSLRIVYVGGLAPTDPVLSVWTSTTAALMTVGNFIQGAFSLAVGQITAVGTGGISYRSVGGIFQPGEVITEYAGFSNSLTTSGPTGPTGQTATLTACTTQSLAESNPDLVSACELFVQYLKSNKTGFNLSNATLDSATKFSLGDMQRDFFANPLVRDLLRPYQNELDTERFTQ